MMEHRIVWLACLVFLAGGLSACTAQGSDCTTDSDCPAHQQCSPGGGVFFGGGLCLDRLSMNPSDDQDTGLDVQEDPDTDSDVLQDADNTDLDVREENDIQDEQDGSPQEEDSEIPEDYVLSVAFVEAPEAVSKKASANFTFQCSTDQVPEVETACTYECKIEIEFLEPDGARAYRVAAEPYREWTACDDGLSLETLWAGNYILKVRATDDQEKVAEVDYSWVKTYVSWKSVAAGFMQSCGIDEHDKLWCWGSSGYGALGIKDRYAKTPTRVHSDHSWNSVSVGTDHVCAISDKKQLWCWGNNQYGQLGIPEIARAEVPTLVHEDDGWEHVSAGRTHTCGVFRDILYCWGTGESGELGLGDKNKVDVPERVFYDDPMPWLSISVRAKQSCAVNAKEELWCWGSNKYGQIALEDLKDYYAPHIVKHADRQWSSVSLGEFHGCGLTKGHVWCWGTDETGQLGQGEPSGNHLPIPVSTLPKEEFMQISSGAAHVCAVHPKGDVFCWGEGKYGKVGQGKKEPQYSAHLLNDENDNHWSALSLGVHHTCGIRNHDEIWCWGDNEFFQLGQEEHVQYYAPQKVRAHQK